MSLRLKRLFAVVTLAATMLVGGSSIAQACVPYPGAVAVIVNPVLGTARNALP